MDTLYQNAKMNFNRINNHSLRFNNYQSIAFNHPIIIDGRYCYDSVICSRKSSIGCEYMIYAILSDEDEIVYKELELNNHNSLWNYFKDIVTDHDGSVVSCVRILCSKNEKASKKLDSIMKDPSKYKESYLRKLFGGLIEKSFEIKSSKRILNGEVLQIYPDSYNDYVQDKNGLIMKQEYKMLNESDEMLMKLFESESDNDKWQEFVSTIKKYADSFTKRTGIDFYVEDVSHHYDSSVLEIKIPNALYALSQLTNYMWKRNINNLYKLLTDITKLSHKYGYEVSNDSEDDTEDLTIMKIFE